MADNDVKFRVREWRERRGFTVLQLSEAANINRANLYQIEADETEAISKKVLSRLAAVLNVKPSELIAP